MIASGFLNVTLANSCAAGDTAMPRSYERNAIADQNRRARRIPRLSFSMNPWNVPTRAAFPALHST
jgi:hypothetical protein